MRFEKSCDIRQQQVDGEILSLSVECIWANKQTTNGWQPEKCTVNRKSNRRVIEHLLFPRNSWRASSWMSLWLTKAGRGGFSLRPDGVCVTARMSSGLINIRSRMILRKIPDLVKPYIMSSRHTCLDSLLSAVLRVIRCTFWLVLHSSFLLLYGGLI